MTVETVDFCLKQIHTLEARVEKLQENNLTLKRHNRTLQGYVQELLQKPIQKLHNQTMGNWKWDICESNLEENRQKLDRKKHQHFKLNDICSEALEDSEEVQKLQQTLDSIPPKLANVERVVDYLEYGAKGVDPRIDMLYRKIERFSRPSDNSSFKDVEYALDCIRRFITITTYLQTNEETSQAANEMKSKLEKLLEQWYEEGALSVLTYNYDGSIKSIYKDAEIKAELIPQCIELGKVFVILKYLERALGKDNPLTIRCKHTLSNGHFAAAQYFKEYLDQKGDLPHSLKIEDLKIYPVAAAPYPSAMLLYKPDIRETGLSFAANASVEEISKQLTLLQQLAATNKVKAIGAHLTIAHLHWGIALHANGQVSFFSAPGDHQSNGALYRTVFRNLGQAAKGLRGVLEDEAILDAKLPAMTVTISPYCLQEELDNVEEDKAQLLKNTLSHCSTLQTIIDALLSLSQEGYCAIEPVILQLCENKPESKAIFSLSGDIQPENIGKRFSHHMQKMHSIEAQEKILASTDPEYGFNTFMRSVSEGGATLLEKLRVVQRTQVELLLETLRMAIQRGDLGATQEALKKLEALKMDAKDCPNGINPAYSLFGNIYLVYKSAWEAQRNQMPNLHTISEFGRKAFLDEKVCGLVPSEYKLQALKQLTQAIKDTWKF